MNCIASRWHIFHIAPTCFMNYISVKCRNPYPHVFSKTKFIHKCIHLFSRMSQASRTSSIITYLFDISDLFPLYVVHVLVSLITVVLVLVSLITLENLP